MAPGEGNAPSSGLRFRDLTGFSTQSDGNPRDTSKETTGRRHPVLVGLLNRDLTGVKLTAGSAGRNPIISPWRAVPVVAKAVGSRAACAFKELPCSAILNEGTGAEESEFP